MSTSPVMRGWEKPHSDFQPGDAILNLTIFGGACMLATGLVLQFGWPTALIVFGVLFMLSGKLLLQERHRGQ